MPDVPNLFIAEERSWFEIVATDRSTFDNFSADRSTLENFATERSTLENSAEDRSTFENLPRTVNGCQFFFIGVMVHIIDCFKKTMSILNYSVSFSLFVSCYFVD